MQSDSAISRAIQTHIFLCTTNLRQFTNHKSQHKSYAHIHLESLHHRYAFFIMHQLCPSFRVSISKVDVGKIYEILEHRLVYGHRHEWPSQAFRTEVLVGKMVHLLPVWQIVLCCRLMLRFLGHCTNLVLYAVYVLLELSLIEFFALKLEQLARISREYESRKVFIASASESKENFISLK